MTKNLENVIINAEPSTLEKCWSVLQSSVIWTGITALVMGGYMWNQLSSNPDIVEQNISDLQEYVSSPEKMREMFMYLFTFATSVVATGIFLTITGINHGNEIAKKDK